MKKKNQKIISDFILQSINEARIKEELAIPLYSGHIKQTLFWSGLPKVSRDKIMSGLTTLKTDSIKHCKILKRVADNYIKNNK